MNRRSFLQTASLSATTGLAGMMRQTGPQPAGHHVAEPPGESRPNVIWIFGDQFRAQALRQNGDPNARTPNLDRAEVNGVTFTNHVSGFVCSCCPA